MPPNPPRRRAARKRGRWTIGWPYWAAAVLVGTSAVVASIAKVGPAWLGEVGAVVVTTAYVMALAVRTGGRPVVFGALSVLIGVATIWSDWDSLRTGSAALATVVAAVLGVLETVPARRTWEAGREVLVALSLACVGGLAALALHPAVDPMAFGYGVLAMALIMAVQLVWRLGAGLHGLGRRGLLSVVVGSVLLFLLLGYATLVSRYGSNGLLASGHRLAEWSRGNLGGFPNLVIALLGAPALMWGTRMRSRRRQGWWVCAFGVAATARVTEGVLTGHGLLSTGLGVLYGAVIGILLGIVVIRLDGLFSARARRGRRAEPIAVARPEPPRGRPLF